MGAAAAVAGIGAAAGIGGALISGGAAKSAANTQAQAAQNAQNTALQQYYQTRADLQPYRDVGASSANQLASFFNGTNPTGELTALENTPGYQFALTQGLKSVQNANAARGLGISGAALKGAAQYATGLAQNTYQANLLNPLQYLSSLGETAAQGGGSLGVQAISNANQAAIGGANAQAAGTVGAANALAGGLNSAASAPLNYLLFSGGLNGLTGNNTGFVDSGTF